MTFWEENYLIWMVRAISLANLFSVRQRTWEPSGHIWGQPILTSHQTFVFRKVISPQRLKNPLWDQPYLRILESLFLLSPTWNATFECLLAQVWNVIKRDSHFSGYQNWTATMFLCRDLFYLKDKEKIYSSSENPVKKDSIKWELSTATIRLLLQKQVQVRPGGE